MPETDSIEAIVQQANRLYSLPAVAVEVLQLTERPEVDASALKQCIENDPALTSKVLKVVNSSLFGLSCQVSDLNQAISLLGIKPLKLLVLGFSLPERLFAAVAAAVLAKYWRTALTKSVAARQLSERYWDTPGDEAFIAALLEDIGMLVLIQQLGAAYVTFLDELGQSGCDVRAMEVDALGFSHTEVSARLLEHWNLPKPLIRAIAAPKSVGHLKALPQPAATLPQVLHLAELVSQLVAEHRIGVLPDLLEAGEAYRGFTRATVTELVRSLEPKVEQLAEVLSLDLPEGKDYEDVLLEAHQLLIESADDSAGELCRRQHNSADGDKLLSATRSLTRMVRQFASETETAGQREAVATEPQPVSASATAVMAASEAGEVRGHRRTLRHGADSALMGHLATNVAKCRSRRCELSLLLVEIDDYRGVVMARGLAGAERLLSSLDAAFAQLDHAGSIAMRTGEGTFAIVAPDCDRTLAVQLGNQVVQITSLVARVGVSDQLPETTVSIGAATVAVPPRNFSGMELVEAANRCLSGARCCGGSAVKSIEL